MALEVSMCHTKTILAYKRLGPLGTIRVAGYLQEPRRQKIDIFASNIYGISEDRPQEQLQKYQDVITPEYPQRPRVIISGDLHCVP